MFDLSSKAVSKYWKEHENSDLVKIIASIEDIETWTLDGNDEIEEQLKILGESISNSYLVDINEANLADDLIRLLSCIKIGRMLRILQILDENSPGIATKLLIDAEEKTSEEDDYYSIFLNRNLIFERLRLAGRVFSEERVKLVTSIIEKEQQ